MYRSKGYFYLEHARMMAFSKYDIYVFDVSSLNSELRVQSSVYKNYSRL